MAPVLDLRSLERSERASLRLDLQPSVHAVATARRLVIELLRRPVGEGQLGVIGLLASELVTNAVVHATTPFVLAVDLAHDVVRVSVGDDGPGDPRPQGRDDGDEHGRGLRLVADLATRWGIDRLPSGKRVWFELDVSAPDR
jgi:anti-sigma regulatory factor (Ser/Thr protein kinase)